jgi:preprotein translocase SecE subunit
MNKYQKYVDGLFAAAAFLVWLVSSHYLVQAIVSWGLQRKLGDATRPIQIVIPLLLALGCFLILRRNQQVHAFATDAVAELSRVSWPSPKETRVGTVVVIITVLLAGAILGVVDLGFIAFVKTLINL